MRKKKRRKLSRAAWLEAMVGFFFITPNFLGFLVFTSLPVLASLILAFVQWDILTPPHFVGIQNFLNLLGCHREEGRIVANDPLFWKYCGNTLFLMAGSIIVLLPVVVVFIFNQRYFVEGIKLSGIKG